MLINEDLTKRAVVHAGRIEWVPSPIKGVDRRMLFRIGGEKARATSIVRYAAGSRFSYHQHPGGEEFLVLDGVFQDETGDFPAGTYVRNPPGTGHAPGSADGCVILVKLWQFKTGDQERLVCRPGEGVPQETRSGAVSSRVLYDADDERVLREDWEPEATIHLENPEGLELLVLAGELTEKDELLDCWTWLRLPAGQPFDAVVGKGGARVWMKSGPLLHHDVCKFEDADNTKEK
jgi:quercetin dioxygenase-like cupin family protein